MKCRPPNGYPNATMQWEHDGKPLVPKQYQVEIIDSKLESQVKFRRITWEDRGGYKCIAKNTEGKESSAAAFLTVKGMHRLNWE